MGSSVFRPVPGAYYTLEYRGPLVIDGMIRRVYFRLGVKDSSQDDFASIITTNINTSDPIPTNQQFRFEEVESGWFVIIARHSGKVLDVQGFSQDEGGKIIQYHRWDALNQQWSISGIEPTKFVLRSRNSGKVLQMPLLQNNGQVKQYSFSDAERWTIHRVEAPPFVPERNAASALRPARRSTVS